MREFMKLFETEQGTMINLTQRVRNSIAPHFQGQCEGAAADLQEMLADAGIEAQFVEGKFDQPMDWGDGTTHPFTPHCWVETADLILDPSAEQFGTPIIVYKDSPEAAPYRNESNLVEAAYPIASRDEWYSNCDYEARGAKMVMMTPDEYLSKVKPLTMDEESIENIDDLANHMTSGRTLDPLAIYADGKEDGRHRAYAAKKLGITQVPVLLF